MPDVPDRALVVVANRLPVSRGEHGWRPSAGGLVTALRPAIGRTGGAWVGWDDDPDGVPARVEGLACELHPVALSDAQVEGYYHGFANRTLWPLLHDLVAQPVVDRAWWHVYEEVNQLVADRVAEVVSAHDPQPMVWVHDYHLLLLPGLLRAAHPDLRIGFFLHTPFPPPELLARLPWRDRLLEGMVGADSLGFHTPRYRDNFVTSAQQLLPGVTARRDALELADGREVRTNVHPISIDAAEFATLARSEATEHELAELREQFAGRTLFLGVDRLDYTKGIRHRLQSIELLLERHPELRSHFAFVQIAVPSRDDVAEYRALRTHVETEVGRINGRFTEPGQDVPVHYLYRGISRPQLAAYYRLADVMCVTPLKDGMNLVAKEYVTVQDAVAGTGVLLLSELCGAAIELGEDVVRTNPFDVEGQAERMRSALEIDVHERRRRIARMAAHVRGADVHRWVVDELTALTAEGPAPRGTPPPSPRGPSPSPSRPTAGAA